jgi:hypothetical protein
MGKEKIMLVRPLRPGDMDNAMILMGYYQDELGIDQDNWLTDSVVASVKYFASHSECCCLIAVEHSRVVGILLGNAKKEFYNNDWATAVQLLYFMPSHNNMANQLQIYTEFRKWSEKLSAKKIMLLDVGDKTDRLDDLADILEFDTEMFKIYTKDGA